MAFDAEDSAHLREWAHSTCLGGGTAVESVAPSDGSTTGLPAIVIHRIEIATRRGLRDARGEHAAGQIRDFLHIDVGGVRTRDVYHLEAELERRRARAGGPRARRPGAAAGRRRPGRGRPVRRRHRRRPTSPASPIRSARAPWWRSRTPWAGRWATAAAVYTSVLYLLDGVDRAAPSASAAELLANPAIQTARVARPDASGRGRRPICRCRRSPAASRPAVPDDRSLGRRRRARADQPRRAAGAVARRDGRHPRPLPPRRRRSRDAPPPASATRPPTSSSSAWPRPGASTASTRSSTPPSPTAKATGRAGDDPLAVRHLHPRR